MRRKGTQTVSLPISVSLANIETSGTTVKIWKEKTPGQAAAPAPTHTEARDCEIKIRVI